MEEGTMLNVLIGLACIAIILHHLDTLLVALGMGCSVLFLLAVLGALVWGFWMAFLA